MMHAARTLLFVEREISSFYTEGPEAIVPWVHYVPVRADLRDLVTQAEWVLTNPAEATRIARAGQRHAQRYFTYTYAVHRLRETHAHVQAPAPYMCAPGVKCMHARQHTA